MLAKSVLEAVLFASPEPLHERELQAQLAPGVDIVALLVELQADYAGRGVRLEAAERRWAFRSAPELAPYLVRVARPVRRLSKAALETLAIVAYRQPVTRAEVEAVRGVTVAKGTFDVLVEAGWVMPKGRRDVPGRPVTWVTTPAFLDQFGLATLADLPRLEELAGVGLFNSPGQG